jgi:hypothetical protein
MQDLSPPLSRLDRYRNSWFHVVLRAVLGVGFLSFAVEAFVIDDLAWGVICATFAGYAAFTAVVDRRRPTTRLFVPVFLLVATALITAGVLALPEGTAGLAALSFAAGFAICATLIALVLLLPALGRRRKGPGLANGH